MATITVISPDAYRTITDDQEMALVLGAAGVGYAQWGVERVPARLRGRNLDDGEKAELLALFAPEIAELKAKHGYVTADVVTLWKDTPELPRLLETFARRHWHGDDEVRFCIQGRGVFTVYLDQEPTVDIEVHPGDFISVPARTHHCFNLGSDRHITCIRVFKDPAGWVGHVVE